MPLMGWIGFNCNKGKVFNEWDLLSLNFSKCVSRVAQRLTERERERELLPFSCCSSSFFLLWVFFFSFFLLYFRKNLILLTRGSELLFYLSFFLFFFFYRSLFAFGLCYISLSFSERNRDLRRLVLSALQDKREAERYLAKQKKPKRHFFRISLNNEHNKNFQSSVPPSLSFITPAGFIASKLNLFPSFISLKKLKFWRVKEWQNKKRRSGFGLFSLDFLGPLKRQRQIRWWWCC